MRQLLREGSRAVWPCGLSLPIALLIIAAGISTGQTPANRTSATYEGTNEDFANPERGFYIQRSFNPARPTADSGALTESDLQAARERRMTLVRMLYLLRDYREAPIPEELVTRLAADFSRARKAGVKLIPRFSYSSAIGQPDASLERILAHIGQLMPVLQANADVIAFFEAGFAGAWGEWHSSTNGLFSAGPGVRWPQVNERTRAILDSLMDVLPRDRMIAVRCPRFKWGFFGEEALNAKTGFSGTPKARTGAINDCFLASPNDSGTYTERMAEEKAFFHQDNLFVPQGGETCSAGPAAQPYIACANALKEMEYLRYSTLNIDYHRSVLAEWEKGGCLAEIRRRMGYRFRMLESRMPERVRPGGAFEMSFTVSNDGWANLYNPRPVEVLFRNKESGRILTLTLSEEPRLWMPGEKRTVELQAGIPAAAPAGLYDVLLRLPDAAPSLKNRPEYAIRFADDSGWEPAAGANRLRGAVRVDPGMKAAQFSGKQWFQ